MKLKRSDLYKIERELGVENWLSQAPFIRLAPGLKSRDEAAITGFNGFLYIYNGANSWEKQLLGEYIVEKFPIDRYLDSLITIRTWVDEIDCKLLNLVIPEKQLLFPELRFGAKFDKEIFSKRPFHVFQDRFNDIAHVCAYPLEELKSLSVDADVFYRTNSHLSASGMLTVFECLIGDIAKAISMPLDVNEVLSSIDFEFRWVEHDLVVKFVDNYFLDKVITFATPTYSDFYRPSVGNLGTRFSAKNDSAPHNLKILVLGDSYSYDAGLSYMLSRAFRQVHFIWADALSKSTIDGIRPDVLILESTERRWFALHATVEGTER
jgi:hypothetical protein